MIAPLPDRPTDAQGMIHAWRGRSDAELEAAIAACDGPLKALRQRVLDARRRPVRP